MDTSPSLSRLEIRKTFNADQQTVFDALTSPEQLGQWFYAMDEGYAKAEVDLIVGGQYAIEMINVDHETVATAYGEFLEIDPPKKLSMTWRTKGFVDYSILTFELTSNQNGTELILTHDLPEPTVEPHREGWATCLGHLHSFLTKSS